MAKSITVERLIKELQGLSRMGYAKAEVYLSSDEEGNGYGTMNPTGDQVFSLDTKRRYVILYPWEEMVEIEGLDEEGGADNE